MNDRPTDHDKSYAAVWSYHNTLVQARLSGAALYMTSAAFLVAAYFSDTSKWAGYPQLIPFLGLAVTVAAWIMELRIESMLATLADLGASTEKALSVPPAHRMFELMLSKQTHGVRVPFFRWRLPPNSRVSRYLFSTAFGLELMYLSFLAFWCNALWVLR